MKLVEETTNLKNDMMDSEYPSTPFYQLLLSLSTNVIKDSYFHIGGNMDQLPDHKKWTVAAVIVQK